MDITPSTHVADIVTAAPATIAVFQKHQIEFCCGGHVPLGVVCEEEGLDLAAFLGELEAAQRPFSDTRAWDTASLADLVAHIQQDYHQPLYEELPRLSAMMNKVATRHADRLPETLPPLKATFDRLMQELIVHMRREDVVLFPAIVMFEGGSRSNAAVDDVFSAPVAAMERDHAAASDALARMRDLTGGYEPPRDACPTFRGLYYGLADLEHRMRLHVRLENDILFPRALALGA